MVEGETGFFHRVGDGHGLEVAAVVDTGGGRVDERVVRCCVSTFNEKRNEEGQGEETYWNYTPA